MEFTILRKVIAETAGPLRLDKALAAAEKIAGRDGYIMTIPQLIDARLAASSDEYIWENWFTGLSEEDYGIDKQGNRIDAVSHGQGPLTKSRRMKTVFDSQEHLTYGYAKLSDHEFAQVLKHAIPLEEIKGKSPQFPEHYTLVGKVDRMGLRPMGLLSLDDFRVDDRFLMAVGSEERRAALLDKIKNEFHSQRYRNGHRVRDIDYTTPQGRVLFVNSSNIDLYGYYNLNDNGCFVVVGA